MSSLGKPMPEHKLYTLIQESINDAIKSGKTTDLSTFMLELLYYSIYNGMTMKDDEKDDEKIEEKVKYNLSEEERTHIIDLFRSYFDTFNNKDKIAVLKMSQNKETSFQNLAYEIFNNRTGLDNVLLQNYKKELNENIADRKKKSENRMMRLSKNRMRLGNGIERPNFKGGSRRKTRRKKNRRKSRR